MLGRHCRVPVASVSRPEVYGISARRTASEQLTSQCTCTLHAPVALYMLLQCGHGSFSSDTGLAHKQTKVYIMYLAEDRLQTRYIIIVDGAIHGWSMRKKVNLLSVDIHWFQSSLSI